MPPTVHTRLLELMVLFSRSAPAPQPSKHLDEHYMPPGVQNRHAYRARIRDTPVCIPSLQILLEDLDTVLRTQASPWSPGALATANTASEKAAVQHDFSTLHSASLLLQTYHCNYFCTDAAHGRLRIKYHHAPVSEEASSMWESVDGSAVPPEASEGTAPSSLISTPAISPCALGGLGERDARVRAGVGGREGVLVHV